MGNSQYHSLQNYQGEGYMSINNYSRTPHNYNEYMDSDINNITKSMKTRREWIDYYQQQNKEIPKILQGPIVLYRGFKKFRDLIQYNKDYCDNCIVDNGFSSSTIDIEYTKIFIDRDSLCCAIYFSLPEHIKFYPYFLLSKTFDEGEFLLERYLKFNISDTPTVIHNTTVYEATVERLEDWSYPAVVYDSKSKPPRSRSPRTKSRRSKTSRDRSRSIKPSRSRLRPHSKH